MRVAGSLKGKSQCCTLPNLTTSPAWPSVDGASSGVKYGAKLTGGEEARMLSRVGSEPSPFFPRKRPRARPFRRMALPRPWRLCLP